MKLDNLFLLQVYTNNLSNSGYNYVCTLPNGTVTIGLPLSDSDILQLRTLLDPLVPADMVPKIKLPATTRITQTIKLME